VDSADNAGAGLGCLERAHGARGTNNFWQPTTSTPDYYEAVTGPIPYPVTQNKCGVDIEIAPQYRTLQADLMGWDNGICEATHSQSVFWARISRQAALHTYSVASVLWRLKTWRSFVTYSHVVRSYLGLSFPVYGLSLCMRDEPRTGSGPINFPVLAGYLLSQKKTTTAPYYSVERTIRINAQTRNLLFCSSLNPCP
jgi:hypothetical protein